MSTHTTTAEDNKLHNLSPAARNEGPDNHKDNSKQMGKVHNDAVSRNKENDKGSKDNNDAGEVNEDNE